MLYFGSVVNFHLQAVSRDCTPVVVPTMFLLCALQFIACGYEIVTRWGTIFTQAVIPRFFWHLFVTLIASALILPIVIMLIALSGDID